MIGVYYMSTGGITGTVVDIRLLLSVALKTAATGIILAYNHQWGNLKPSEADKELTNKIKKVSEYMDIKLLDVFIITPDSYLSINELGYL